LLLFDPTRPLAFTLLSPPYVILEREEEGEKDRWMKKKA